MTTTMLSSKKPSEKLFDRQFFDLYKNTVRQNLLAMILYTVCLLLITVLPTYTSVTRMFAITDLENIGSETISLLTFSYSLMLLGLVVPVLLAAMLFHYLHNRLSVDFYHSMPVNRTKLFLSKYFAGLTFLLAPVLLTKVLCAAIHLIFCSSIFRISYLLAVHLTDLLFWFVMYAVVFTFSCAVAVTSSNAVESIIYSVAVNGLLTGILCILDVFSRSLYGVEASLQGSLWISPYETMAIYADNRNIDNIKDFSEILLPVLFWLVVGVAALMLALYLYRRFLSEWAQQWGRQTVFTQLMKIAAGFLMMFIIFVMGILNGSVANALLGVLVGVPLGFLLVEGVTGKGFGNLRSSLKYIAAAMAVCMIVPAFLATNGFGMAYRVPKVSSIEEISVRESGVSRYNIYAYYYWDKNGLPHSDFYDKYSDIRLTSDEAKELITTLHANGTSLKGYSGLRGNNTSFTYTLSPLNRKVRRNYVFSVNELPLLAELYCLPEYIRQVEPVFFYQPVVLEEVTFCDKTGATVAKIPAEQYEALLEAVRTDLLTMTGDRLNDFAADPSCGYLSFSVKRYNEQDGVNLNLRKELTSLKYGSSPLQLRSSYKNTLALLKNLGIDPQETGSKTVESVVISMPFSRDIDLNMDLSICGSLERAEDDSSYGDNLRWEISDPDLVEKILSASSLNRSSVSCNHVYMRMNDSMDGSHYRGEIFIENSTLLSILKDSGIQVPYLLSADELDQAVKVIKENNPSYYNNENVISSYDRKAAAGRKWNLLDVSEDTSVAEFARLYDLDWFSGKTLEQLAAMETTALTCSNNTNMIFYDILVQPN